MQKHNLEVFLLEGLQPSWLQTQRCQRIYFFASRLIDGLSLGLAIGWDAGAESWPDIISGLITGLSVGFIDGLRFEWLNKWRGIIKSHPFWWSGINIVILVAISGLIFALVYGAIIRLLRLDLRMDDPIFALMFGLINGPIFGLVFGLRGSRQSLENDIQTVEALRWSWRKASMGGLMGGIGGLTLTFLGLIALDGFPLDITLRDFLFVVLVFGPSFGLTGAFINGLHREIIETKSAPNQGIRLSIRNAVFGGLLFGLIVGLGYGLGDGLYFYYNYGLYTGLLSGLSLGLHDFLGVAPGLGLVGALWYGGFDVIQHYTLRLILLIQGHTPANYARFLDYAVDRIFLQKVGGGYRFIHRLLLEHFAELGEMKKV
jgi:hypothetical protein